MKYKLVLLKNGNMVDEFYTTILPAKDDVLVHLSRRFKVVAREINFTSQLIKISVLELA